MSINHRDIRIRSEHEKIKTKSDTVLAYVRNLCYVPKKYTCSDLLVDSMKRDSVWPLYGEILRSFLLFTRNSIPFFRFSRYRRADDRLFSQSREFVLQTRWTRGRQQRIRDRELKRCYRRVFRIGGRCLSSREGWTPMAGAKRRATRKQSLDRIYGCSFLSFPRLCRLSFSRARIHARTHAHTYTYTCLPLSIRQMVRPRFCFKARANNRRITETKRLDDRFFEKKKKKEKEERSGWKWWK